MNHSPAESRDVLTGNAPAPSLKAHRVGRSVDSRHSRRLGKTLLRYGVVTLCLTLWALLAVLFTVFGSLLLLGLEVVERLRQTPIEEPATAK